MSASPEHLAATSNDTATVTLAPSVPTGPSPVTRGLKRGFDLFFSLLALVVLLPILLVVTATVKLSSRGPLLFTHRRIGRDGRTFPCLKFRTMVHDAEHRLAELLDDPTHAEEFHDNHKLRADPRITRVGRFLRQTSLDELPQFVNVLAGHMSVVGPRPVVEEELARYGDAAGHYLSVRPGITGPWQVSGRSDVTFEDRVEMDRRYTETLCLATDLRLTLATVAVIVRRAGAY